MTPADAGPRGLRALSLDDKYDLDKADIYTTGTQALVRLCLMQGARDRAAGLNTAGFVSGYRGSPLGGIDGQFARAKARLDAAGIVVRPGLNEDLAATAVWGTQQATLRGEGRVDGVFALWYGKGPGVDRSGDALRHANLAGTHARGGVLALLGDDHTAESSTTAHQSEFALLDAMMPVLSPAGVQEILDYGLYGWAMSRYAGTWVGLKCVKDNVESTTSVDGALDRVRVAVPTDFALPPGGLNIRAADAILDQEERLHRHKIEAALAFLRANGLDRLLLGGGQAPRIGVVTSGKSTLDVRQALDALGIDAVRAAAVGLRLYKVAGPWPLEPTGLRAFADGLALVIVVEEKRALIETQVRAILYGTANAPAVIGKADEAGGPLFPSYGALEPSDIAIVIGERLMRVAPSDELAARLGALKAAGVRAAAGTDVATRAPYFCAGCPHSTSTRIPEGSRAYAGIGCHYMAQWMDRGTEGYTHMGGEGANWVGEAPFSTRAHVFQNLGDGTYNHSGSLAIRFAVGAGVDITYKILFNDAVAMTGGQRHDGGLTVPRIAAQVSAEGVGRIAVVTDEPHKYPPGTPWPAGTTLHHRDDLIPVQRELAGTGGVTVLIYDQTCASEKRRRRKRGEFPDPDRRVIINDLVCEGCGDCGVKSNCVAVQPLETPFGRKRRIDQSTCNTDFSCVNGFCPSFVTVHGARPRGVRGTGGGSAPALPEPALPEPALPEPALAPIAGTYNILVSGVGGTGIVTLGAVLSMAAHLEGRGFGAIDMAGLAQKGGAVFTHLKIAARPQDISAIRIGPGSADLLIGGDLAVAGTAKALASLGAGRTRVLVNTAEVLPGAFTRDADFSLPVERVKRALAAAAGRGRTAFIDANACAMALLGTTLGANLFLLGHACQSGALPVSAQAIERAIALNGEAVAMNLSAFRWGRRAVAEPEAVAARVGAAAPQATAPETLDDAIARRAAFLAAYQDEAYAARYGARIAAVREAERRVLAGATALTDAAARSLFKLMAYKDEYEVARLYTDGHFARQVADAFEGEALRFEFHLAPPLLARPDPVTGEPRKIGVGQWAMTAFGLLARLRRLRGTAFDPFGYTHERRTERALVAAFEARLDRLAERLDMDNHAAAVALAALPQKIRGFGPVKRRALEAVRAEEATLVARFERGAAGTRVAAE